MNHDDDPGNCLMTAAAAAVSLQRSLATVEAVTSVRLGRGPTIVVECSREISGLPNSWSGFPVLVTLK